MARIPTRTPNLAMRVFDLQAMDFPDATCHLYAGRKLVYRFQLSPSLASRVYDCELHVKPGKVSPELFVISPDLYELSGDRRPPHTYSHEGKGTQLCLWRPKYNEWQPFMKLSETYIPWTAEWLLYFENWLVTGEWVGGGEHPIVGSSKPLSRQ